MFIHASAVFSILVNGNDRNFLLDKLDAAKTPLITSPVELMESVLSVSKAKQISTGIAGELVIEFMTALKVQTVRLTPEIVRGAVEARVQYGKPHRAGLSKGDAFAYACAKNYKCPLLYAGICFRGTDLA